MTDTTYNGWKNWATWNVALWVQNDQVFYNIARGCDSYVQWLRNVSIGETPDGANLFGKELDVRALDKMILDL